jgi:D-alanyl-lipoteichoic acid acyltransferase DltB (MBOAT superfamily)
VHDQAVAALTRKPSLFAHLPPYASLSVATLSYMMFLFWNFSAYMDIVIAAGELMGVTLPENFDHPFRAPSFIDFWSRWHITLSDWFRFYLFNPIVAALTRARTRARLAPYYGVVGFLVTFFVMGLWHGTTSIFFLYGLLLGGGVSLNKLYQIKMRDWLGKARYKALARNMAYQRTANGLMLAFFALALSCFWLQWEGLTALVRGVGALGLGEALALGAWACMSVILAADGIAWLAPRLHLDRVLASRWSKTAVVAAGVLAVVLHATVSHSDAPAFVYAEF